METPIYYFDLLNTESFTNQTTTLSKGLNTFLNAIQMIILQNLNEIEELTLHEISTAADSKAGKKLK
jgi:hypothetical protein